MNTLKITWSLVLAGAVVTAACSDSKSSMNPVAPSAVVSGAQSEEAGDPGAVSMRRQGQREANPATAMGTATVTATAMATAMGTAMATATAISRPLPSAPQPPTNTTPGAPGLKKVEIEGLISVKGGNTIVVNASESSWCPRPARFATVRHSSRLPICTSAIACT